jgi:hypothetical protein
MRHLHGLRRLFLRRRPYGTHREALHSGLTTDALTLLCQKTSAWVTLFVIKSPDIFWDESDGIWRILHFVAMSMLSVVWLLALVAALVSTLCAWVSFHVAVRIWRSRSAEGDDDGWIPRRSLLETGFTTTWRWPFYREPEEQQDGYVKLESAV